MDWIDQNLDAYRVIAEILTDLRPLVRERLEASHGKEWFKDGIPEKVFENLIQNKEQEASIDWYENRYQEVISYAVFPDLFEIILANSALFEPILKLAPSKSLLNTRFLELEVMRSKIGRGRQVSEAEINFLTSFHLRFRRAIQELRADDGPVPHVPPVPRKPGAETDPAASDERLIEVHPDSIVTEEPEPVEAEIEEPAAPKLVEGPGRPPMRMASPTSAPETAAAPPEPGSDDQPDAADTTGKEPAAENDKETKKRETPIATVKRALEEGDDKAVLRELYREVTGIAEVIWTTNEIPTTGIWDRVSVTPWYESGFSRLELRPLSDFYELISQVRKQRKAGASKKDIQSFLNDSKFATTLMSLRDMFQRNSL